MGRNQLEVFDFGVFPISVMSIVSLVCWFLNVLDLVYILFFYLNIMVRLLCMVCLDFMKALQGFCKYHLMTLISVRVSLAILFILISCSLLKLGNLDTIANCLRFAGSST